MLTRYITIVFLVLTGCSSNLKTVQYNEIVESTSYRYTQKSDESNKDLAYYKTAYDSAGDNCLKKKEIRNSILFEQMRLIDSAYYDYESKIRKGIDGKKLFVDISSMSISGIATIAGGAGVKSLLALIDTGLKGASSAYDNDYLEGKAVDMIISEMRAARAKAATKIIESMKDELCQYSIENGIFDLGSYLRVGSVDNALISLSASASNLANNAETELRNALQTLTSSKQNMILPKN
jgi:hypothetical protein